MSILLSLIKPAKDIPQATLDEDLGSALALTRSSHDPVFVMEQGELVGIVSSSFALFKRRLPMDTKVSRAMRKPPRISKSTDLFTVAKHMLATRIYTLPVFMGKNFIGVVSAADILNYICGDETLLKLLQNHTSIDRVVTNSGDNRIGEIYTLQRKEKTSRIVIVNGSGQVIGVVTRRDIQEGLLAPTKKIRFGKNKRKPYRSYSFDEEKLLRFDYSIKEFMTENVIMAPEDVSLQDILRLMLENKVNSVVIVGINEKPKGIISFRNLLKGIARLTPEEEKPIMLSDRHQKLTNHEKERVLKELQIFVEKFEKHDKVRLVETVVSAYQNRNGKPTAFEIHLRLHLQDGRGFMTQVEDKVLWTALHQAISKVYHQAMGKSLYQYT